MKVANIIIAHKYPAQLARMIKAFEHESVHHFIHLDAKADINSFLFIEKLPRVKFITKRCSVNWAGFGGVQCTLNAFEEVLESGIDFDYVNLITGQDYPIKPIQNFLDFLTLNRDKDFFQFQHAETEWLEAVHRFRRYHLTELNIKGRYRFENLINFLMPKRKVVNTYEIYGRSAYFTITLDCVKFIQASLAQNIDYIKYFKTVWAPDEMFFQTLLLNSIWKDKIVNNNLRHIEWFPKVANPKIFTSQDFSNLNNSPAFIARKFDEKIDVEILNQIDTLIAKS